MHEHAPREPLDGRTTATSAQSRYLYVGHGGHARPVISDEAHDPLTEC